MDNFSKINDYENQQNLIAAKEISEKIPLLEERLVVDVRQVETGKVQINKKITTQEISQDVPLTEEEVQVERIAINKYVEAAPVTRYEGDTTIISVVKEVLVVEKRLMLVEELHIKKKQVTTTATVNEVLRKEEIEVNRIKKEENNITSNQ